MYKTQKFYLFFLLLFIFSPLSNALTKAEKHIIDNSSDVKLFTKYLIEHNLSTSRLKYKIIKKNKIFTTSEGYLHEQQLPSHWTKDLPLLRAFLIALNSKGKIISVTLNQSGIRDLSVFKKLTKLRALKLHRNNFKSKSLNISGLPLLEELKIVDNNNIEEIIIGSNTRNLKTLDLSDLKKLTTIKNLKKLRKLQRLNIRITSISEIKELSSLKELKWLNIEKSPIKSLPSLKKLKKLTTLVALDTHLTDIKDIPSSKLKVIDLHRTIAAGKIKIYPKSLEELQIGGEHVKSIPLLNNYKNLKKLTIIGGEFSKIENLKGLTQLKELDLRYSTITNIEGLDDLISLERLDLENTKITKIEGLNYLANLKDLKLNQTNIKKIEGLEKLKSLELLDFTYTKVKKIENIGHLKNLKVVTFAMCPIEEYNYKATLNNIVNINAYATPFAEKLEAENNILYKQLRKKDKI